MYRDRTGTRRHCCRNDLKLYLYGYMYGIRSCRRLERECHKNTEVLWLLIRLTPDFKTIANRRVDNRDALLRRKDLAKELVTLDTRIAGWQFIDVESGTTTSEWSCREWCEKHFSDRLRDGGSLSVSCGRCCGILAKTVVPLADMQIIFRRRFAADFSLSVAS